MPRAAWMLAEHPAHPDRNADVDVVVAPEAPTAVRLACEMSLNSSVGGGVIGSILRGVWRTRR